jgi:hypothetical protein
MQDCSGMNVEPVVEDKDIIVLQDMLPSEIGSAEAGQASDAVPEPYIVVSEIEQVPDAPVTAGNPSLVIRDSHGVPVVIGNGRPRSISGGSDSGSDVVGPDVEDLDIMEAFKKADCSPAIKQAMIAVIEARRKESAARKKTTAALEQLASLVFEGSEIEAAEA